MSSLTTPKPQAQPCKYKTGKTLGAGSYSVVKECVHIDTGRYYAAKVINKRLMTGREHMVHNEIAVLKRISMGHQNLLTLVDYFETLDNLYLVTDLALGGELFDRICRKGSYHESDAVDLIRAILSGICYMHDHGIVHRDLKPENILFRTPEDNTDLLIADFGLSRIMDEEQFHVLTTTCGTPGYMAPEIFKKSGHGKPVDLWAIGVMTYFLLCGYSPFDRDSNLEEMQAILKADYSFTPAEYWKGVSLDARDFIKRCLVINPEERITAQEALVHPFVSRWKLGKGVKNEGLGEIDLLPAFKTNFNARRTLLAAVDAVRVINKLREGQGSMVDAQTLDLQILDGQTDQDSGYGTAIPTEIMRSDWSKNKEARNLGEAGSSTIHKRWTPATHSQPIPLENAANQGENKALMKSDNEPPTPDREYDEKSSRLSSDGEDLEHILSYCDAESTTDSSSDGGLGLAGMSSFAVSHNDGLDLMRRTTCESPDWNDLPALVEGNSHLERLLWPQKEHEDLLAVRTEVLNKSWMLNTLGQKPSLDPYFESTVLVSSMKKSLPVTSDHDVDRLGEQLESLTMTLSPDSYRLLSEQFPKHSLLDVVVLESFSSLHQARNIILGAYASIKRLQFSGLCEDTISIISADQDRIGVAALQPILTSSIEEVCCDFELSIQSFGSLSEIAIQVQNSEIEKEKLRRIEKLGTVLSHLTKKCLDFLEKVFGQGLEKFSGLGGDNLWDLTAKTIDIAVAFYSCAHVEQPYHNSFQFTDVEDITLSVAPDIVFGAELRNLGCLSGLLQSRRVWVFDALRTGSSSSPLIHERALYLKTSIKDLGDIWGPAWGICLESQPRSIQAYEIGGGSIVPWKYDPSLHPILKENERLCHWEKIEDSVNACKHLETSHAISQRQKSNALASDLRSLTLSTSHKLESAPDIPSAPFSPDDQLLIGATPPRLRFEVCKCQKECIVTELQNSACLYPLNTRRGYHYIDSTSKGLSGGQYINLNASKTKKWQTMVTWKQTILEEWENNPALRGQAILILERFVGVVVSLCTFNAIRVRLVELLKTDSMRQILADFQWMKTESKQLFFEALDNQDYRSIRRLWRDKEDLRDDIGNAISACLKILASTGYDEPHDELNLLWIPSFQPCQGDDLAEKALPQRVVLKGSKHQWIRLLRDTEISCTMAVIVEDSLANRGHGGRSCRRRSPNRPTVLETAIRVNGQVDPSKRLREQPITLIPGNQDPWYQEQISWQKYWDPKLLKQGSTFWLGYQGQLKVAGLISETGLLMTWDKDWVERIRKLFELKPAGPGSISHNEFSGEMWGVVTRPLPVHIMSQGKT